MRPGPNKPHNPATPAVPSCITRRAICHNECTSRTKSGGIRWEVSLMTFAIADSGDRENRLLQGRREMRMPACSACLPTSTNRFGLSQMIPGSTCRAAGLRKEPGWPSKPAASPDVRRRDKRFRRFPNGRCARPTTGWRLRERRATEHPALCGCEPRREFRWPWRIGIRDPRFREPKLAAQRPHSPRTRMAF
jgi:hypothetical protein